MFILVPMVYAFDGVPGQIRKLCRLSNIVLLPFSWVHRPTGRLTGSANICAKSLIALLRLESMMMMMMSFTSGSKWMRRVKQFICAKLELTSLPESCTFIPGAAASSSTYNMADFSSISKTSWNAHEIWAFFAWKNTRFKSGKSFLNMPSCAHKYF